MRRYYGEQTVTDYEKACDACAGTGAFNASFGDGSFVLRTCRKCQGCGFSPTALGEDILSLLDHAELRKNAAEKEGV